MKNVKTLNAFLSRGIDSQTANILLAQNLTMTSLKSLKIDDLLKLGIIKDIAEKIIKENRPPIPLNTIATLLRKTKSTCCVCRNQKKSIIIHHIEPWETSKSHDFGNLVVLCLEHHDEAHSKKELSQNLNAQLLKEFKEKWIKQVEEDDARTILGLIQVEGARWDYINHHRVMGIAHKVKMDLKIIPEFNTQRALDIIDDNGLLNNNSSWYNGSLSSSYMYDFKGSFHLYHYMQNVIEKIIESISIIDISNRWNKTDLKNILQVGNLISCQGGYYFKKSSNGPGKNQITKGYKKANNISLNFVIDSWEATSCSSWACSLSGHKNITSICFVKSIIMDKENMVIDASCLGIGTNFNLEVRK